MSVKLNVLVYSGSGTTVESVRQCLYTLRRLLSPNYAVTTILSDPLIHEPWEFTTALLCVPGGADLGTCKVLNGAGNRKISQFVRRGGAYLGFCAGGYYGSGRCEFEVGTKFMEVVGNRELRFFPGVCRGAAFKGFVYDSEEGAKAVTVAVNHDGFGTDTKLQGSVRMYYNGGGVFVDAEKYKEKGVEILAKYTEKLDVDAGEADAAVIYCKVGDGAAILTGPHPEFAAENLDKANGGLEYSVLVDDLFTSNTSRIDFLTACLGKLGLKTNTESVGVPSMSNLYLSSNTPDEIRGLVDILQDITTPPKGEGKTKLIVCENDVFVLHEAEQEKTGQGKALKLTDLAYLEIKNDKQLEDASVNESKMPKNVQVYRQGYPVVRETPFFNHHIYYGALEEMKTQSSNKRGIMGSPLLYGEVVTSTNTMLDKNFKLLQLLPTGFTVLGTTQTAGRGRGNNVWVSPLGVLTFSLCVRHQWQTGVVAPVIFIQYLAAIAIVEAVKTYGPDYDSVPIRLKWPNDIYIEDSSNASPTNTDSHGKSFVKIGGILVNSSFSGNEYLLVIGCGLNTTNKAPTTSLNQIIDIINKERTKRNLTPLNYFRQEALLAKIIVVFEEMYTLFCKEGFGAFERKYYDWWLHTDQVVRLDMEGGVKAKIQGISIQDGLLVVEELDERDYKTGKVFTLQTDNNSFDFFKGLLKKKV